MFDNSEYYEGKVACREGYERDENPYSLFGPEYQAWESGWDDQEAQVQIILYKRLDR